MSKLNIIITASPIPSNPSTEIMDKMIQSLSLLQVPGGTKIILAHDYPQPESKIKDAYFDYYEKLKNKYKNRENFVITMADKYGHISGNIRNAFNHVDSRYVLVLQHDFIFVRDVDINLIIQDMGANPQLKHVRFNKRSNRALGGDYDNYSVKVFNRFNVSANYEYTSTPCWSDINHISPTSYYRDVILEECVSCGIPENNFQVFHNLHIPLI